MIYIVIPVFNRKEFTRQCLLSLRKQTFKDFKVIIVDDGSTDGTAQMISESFPEIILLKEKGDLFWTAATNIGIRYALSHGASYVMTLNNDTLATETFMEGMNRWAQKMPDTLLGAFALDSVSQKPVYGGERINWLKHSTTYLLDILPKNEQKGIHEVSHYPGRGLLIPRSVFEKVGLFDERTFPHYYADYDFTHLAARNGFKIYCNYDAQLYTYPNESGDLQNRNKKNLKKYFNHLFGIKGGGNLVNFTKYTFRNCPPGYIPFFLVNGYIRRIAGYLVKNE